VFCGRYKTCFWNENHPEQFVLCLHEAFWDLRITGSSLTRTIGSRWVRKQYRRIKSLYKRLEVFTGRSINMTKYDGI
jgi:hypothetical protein